jgi:hypothetical protein
MTHHPNIDVVPYPTPSRSSLARHPPIPPQTSAGSPA